MANYRFYHPIEIRYGDIDAQGHLNNAKFLTFFEQARIQYLVHLDLFRPGQAFDDIGVILAEVRVTFLEPVLWGMDVQIGVCATRMGNKSLVVAQNVIETASRRELAQGEVVMVTFDYKTGKTIPIPVDWRAKIGAFDNVS